MTGWWMDEFGCWHHTVCGRTATQTPTHLECRPCVAALSWPKPAPEQTPRWYGRAS